MFSSSERMYPQKPHNARDASSLARTRDLIFMNCTMLARTHANYNHKIPGPSQE